MKTLPVMLILSTLLSACAVTKSRNLTSAQASRVESIELLTGGTDRPHRSLGTINGTGCQKSPLSTTIPENDAHQELKYQAASVDADAVISITCHAPYVDWSGGCFRLIVCTGEAVRFTDR